MFIAPKFARLAIAASISAGLMVAAGSAAQAARQTSHTSADPQNSANTQQYVVKKLANGTVQYCTKEAAVTGSRIPMVVCKTQKQWKEAGVELNVG